MKHKKIEVIIIGAGIAGLAAGQALTAAGVDNLTLEARDRYGGRIWPDNSLGSPVARGAQLIHGINDNPMISLAQQFPSSYFNLEISHRSYYIFDRQGQSIAPNIVSDFDHQLETLLHQANKLAWQKEQDISLAESLSSLLNINQWSSVQQDLFTRKLRFFENYIGAEYELLSARHWNEEEETSGETVILEDGYAAIIKGLAHSCTIQLNTTVQSLHSRKDEVEILTDRGVFKANAVIVTLPLGVLKNQKIRFDPPLSTLKQAAIDRLGMGLFNIIGMRFPRIFWPEDGRAFFLPSKRVPVIVNIRSFSNEPILIGWVGGKTGRALENETDVEVIKGVLTQLTVFGKNIPAPERYFLTRWGHDPYSFGSYSYLPVGATGDDRDVLSQPESDNLFFAGEATHRQFPATVHGAYLSGLREAAKIIKILS